MNNGVEIRARIDNETTKALLLVNGGSAAALLALLPAIFKESIYDALTNALLLAMVFYQLGLRAAVVHGYLRGRCSHEYDLHDMRPPPGKLFRCK